VNNEHRDCQFVIQDGEKIANECPIDHWLIGGGLRVLILHSIPCLTMPNKFRRLRDIGPRKFERLGRQILFSGSANSLVLSRVADFCFF
jgi:hypothetical protein